MNPAVLIAGAGPVGLAMAAELTRYGLAVRIVDKGAGRTDKSKALVVWPRTLELMDRLGCTQAFLDAGFKAIAANIVAGEKQIGRITFDHVASPYPFALMIPQSETERLLEEHLNVHGIQVERSTELLTVIQNERTVTATLRHLDGTGETLETDWLIGCDGAHSTVRHQLGVSFVGNTLMTDWILGDLHLANIPNPGEISVFWHSDGILAIFPIGDAAGGRYRIIADAGETKGDTRRPDPTLEEIQGVLARRGPSGVEVSHPIWLAAFTINERKVADYRASASIFLAGDAAHIHSPAGGQGMNTGIQDACNLAWKLALVHRKLAAPSLLESYSIERSAIGEEVLTNAGRLTTVAILRGEVKQSIRNHLASLLFGLSSIRDVAADTITELSIGYPHSPLTANGKGERAAIRTGDQLFGGGNTPHFTLASPDPIPQEIESRYGNLFTPVVMGSMDPKVHGTYDPVLHGPFHPKFITLVRPDGYLALTSPAGSWSEVTAYFQRIAAATNSTS